MMYKWYGFRSHIFPLVSIKYCRMRSLKRNTQIPVCTCRENCMGLYVFMRKTSSPSPKDLLALFVDTMRLIINT